MSLATPSSTPTTPAAHHVSRHEVLRHALPSTVDLLMRRRAGEIDETFIDNYVALGWLEWHGGALRLSPLGSDICVQMQALSAFDDSALDD